MHDMESARIITLEELIRHCKEKCRTLDETDIRSAYEFAEDHWAGTKNADAVISHSLREAYTVADWGLGKDIIVAALLHETVEDRHSTDNIAFKFGENVLEIIESLGGLSDLYFSSSNKSGQITNYDDFPRKKALNNAIYVKIADRIDKLMFGDEVLNIPPVLLVSMTRRELFRFVKRINAYHFVDILEELCFSIDRPDTFNEIMEQCEELRNENFRSFLKVKNILKEVFDPGIENDDNGISEYRSQIKELVIEVRSPGSIIRYLERETQKTFDEWKTHLNKDRVPLYDITLVVDDKLSTDISKFGPNDVFFECFEKCLMDKGIYITAHEYTTRDDRDYFVLTDETDNLYRFYVRTHKEYLRFLYGDIVEETDYQFHNEKQEMELPEPRRPKIKVYKDDGTAVLITNGATVLDFAFFLDAEKGLHFDYARLNESAARIDRNVRLNEGDMVTIVTNDEIRPDISWFESARTGMATKYLVDYFSKRENLAKLL